MQKSRSKNNLSLTELAGSAAKEDIVFFRLMPEKNLCDLCDLCERHNFPCLPCRRYLDADDFWYFFYRLNPLKINIDILVKFSLNSKCL
jgi:hypothetical protein